MRRLALTSLVLFLLLWLAGCGRPPLSPTLVVGTEPGRYPFAWFDQETERYRGLEIDLSLALAREAGMAVDIRLLERSQLLESLLKREISAIISTVPIPAGRSPTVDFSSPYLVGGQIAVVPAASPLQLVSQLAGRSVAVVSEQGYDMIQRIDGIAHNDIRRFNSTGDAVHALKEGTVDAVVADAVEVVSYLHPDSPSALRILGEAFTVEFYGIALRADDPVLKESLERALTRLRASGEHAALHRQWLEGVRWLSPGISGSCCTTLPYRNCSQTR